MPGLIIFDPNRTEPALSTADDQATGAYLDIENDILYFTDTINIYEWEGNTALNQIVQWRSGKIRLPRKVNLGAVLVEANSYDDTTFKLYADEVLITTLPINSAEPVRLPGNYLSNLYEVEIVGTDVITGVSVGTSIFDLAAG